MFYITVPRWLPTFLYGLKSFMSVFVFLSPPPLSVDLTDPTMIYEREFVISQVPVLRFLVPSDTECLETDRTNVNVHVNAHT